MTHGARLPTRTTTRLIQDLRDPANARAWGEFDARYRPILEGFGRRLGFDVHDAAELAQQSLAEFVRSYLDGHYRREQGRLSSWLIGIARNVGSAMRRKQQACVHGGGSIVADLPDDATMTRIWERERQRAILAESLVRLRATSLVEEHTFRAFELFALQGVAAEDAASQCGISVESVYLAKSRLTKRLRETVRELSAAYAECD